MRIPALVLVMALGCGGDEPPAAASKPAGDAGAVVGYDVRRLRPVDGETLAAMFDRSFARARADGKQVAVLFSADWCEPCRVLDLELGNTHPSKSIGHVRIFEMKEEDWGAATRLDELAALRKRWYGFDNSYPVLVVLDAEGKAREEMKDAITRLQAAGIDPSLPNWFAGLADA